MAITILTGLPGSGKSETLISRVRSSLHEGRVTQTIMCSDSPVLQSRPGIAVRRMMSCRSGLSTRLDHFVSVQESTELIADAPSGALLAFDEAQHFGQDVVDSWCAAAARGVEVLIASPSVAQLKALRKRGHEARKLKLNCQICSVREASGFFCHLDQDRTEAVCEQCSLLTKKTVRADIVRQLQSNPPEPGKKCVYQPVELAECSGWNVIRGDSHKRFQVVRKICADQGLPSRNSTYLDVGCNTGFFCHNMSKVGFQSTGVDVTAKDIAVARLLGTYFRRDYASYVVSDAHEHLRTTQGTMFDVTSAFSVFQWVMIQKTPEHGLECMRWLFGKTRRICILEMGESKEAHYVARIGMKFNSASLYDFMRVNSAFNRIDVLDKKLHGLKRDLLVGYTN